MRRPRSFPCRRRAGAGQHTGAADVAHPRGHHRGVTPPGWAVFQPCRGHRRLAQKAHLAHVFACLVAIVGQPGGVLRTGRVPCPAVLCTAMAVSNALRPPLACGSRARHVPPTPSLALCPLMRYFHTRRHLQVRRVHAHPRHVPAGGGHAAPPSGRLPAASSRTGGGGGRRRRAQQRRRRRGRAANPSGGVWAPWGWQPAPQHLR